MELCVYCGRRLPLLHRIVGSSRFCSKRHAELYEKELDQLTAEALSRLRPAAAAPPAAQAEAKVEPPPATEETSRTPEEQVPAEAARLPDHLTPVPAAPLAAAPPQGVFSVHAALPDIPFPPPALRAAGPVEVSVAPSSGGGMPSAQPDVLSSAGPLAPALPAPAPCSPEPPFSTTLQPLELKALSGCGASSAACVPQPPRRRLLAPVMSRTRYAWLAPAPKPALDCEPLSLPAAWAGAAAPSGVLARPLAAPAVPVFPSLQAAWPAAEPRPAGACPVALAGACGQAQSLHAPAASFLEGAASPAIVERRFRVRAGSAIPPLSLYEGPNFPPPVSPLRGWSALSVLPPFQRRAARVVVRAFSGVLVPPALGPLVRAAVMEPAQAPPLSPAPAMPSSLFIPKALALPVRPACSFGPLPSARPAAGPKPTGAIIPIRAAAGRRSTPVLK